MRGATLQETLCEDTKVVPFLRNVPAKGTAQQFCSQLNMLSGHMVLLALHAAREAGKSPLINDLASITVFLNFLYVVATLDF